MYNYQFRERKGYSRDFLKEPVTMENGPTKEDLEKLLNNKVYGTAAASVLNTTITVLMYWMNKYDFRHPVHGSIKDFIDRIDMSKLSRDFTKEPLKEGEAVLKEDLDYLYNVVGLRAPQITQFYMRGYSQGFAYAWMKKLNVYRTNKSVSTELMHETQKKLHGYAHHTQNPEFQKKMVKKYGVSTTLNLPISRQHNAESNRNPEVIAKANATRQKTFQERYQVDTVNQRHMGPEVLAILNDGAKLYEMYTAIGAVGIAHKLNVSTTAVYDHLEKAGYSCDANYRKSSAEQEIASLFPEIIFKKDRTILDGNEIDLYSDATKIGIEFNGDYWHSDQKKDRMYHRDKSRKAESKGVFLFHIFEYEWHDDRIRAAIIGRLNNLFGKVNTTIYARKCELRYIDQKEADALLNQYHVQGKARAEVRLGLFYKDELVSVMEFTSKTLNNHCDWELIRFCGKGGTRVVGAASKLFKRFLKDYNPKKVVSYSDFAKTTGGLYQALGFEYQYLTRPQYVWVKCFKWLTRYQTQRKRLIAAGLMEKDDKRSEATVMRANGYSKIYDCGKKVWYYDNTK